MTSCAADPGGVRSNIWASSPLFKKGLYRRIIDACYSPPEDGAKPIIHAATVSGLRRTQPCLCPALGHFFFHRSSH